MARKKLEPWLKMPRSLLESFAWRAASRGCHQVIARIAIEHMAHAGTQNGKLVVQKKDFVEYGIQNDQVAPALREGCALGLIILTKRGRAGNAEHRAAHQWALAFIVNTRGSMFSTLWKRFQSLQEAKAVAAEARAAKDTAAVANGRRRNPSERSKRAAEAKRMKLEKLRGKIIHFPVPETRTETGPRNQDRRRSQKPGP